MTKRTVMTSGQIAQDLGPIEPARALTVVIPNINDESLISEGETAAAAYAKSGRENILAMARGLAAARRKYPSDQEFGSWFDSSPYSEVVTNKTMRAALIYIGKHDEIAALIIGTSGTVNPEAVARAIKAMFFICKHDEAAAAIIGTSDTIYPETVARTIKAYISSVSEKLKPAPTPNAKHVAKLNKFESEIKAIMKDSDGVSDKAVALMSHTLIPLLKDIREELEAGS